MEYSFKYPEVYAEAARLGMPKKKIADALGISMNGLRYKQSVGDFSGTEMAKISKLLGKSIEELFELSGMEVNGEAS